MTRVGTGPSERVCGSKTSATVATSCTTAAADSRTRSSSLGCRGVGRAKLADLLFQVTCALIQGDTVALGRSQSPAQPDRLQQQRTTRHQRQGRGNGERRDHLRCRRRSGRIRGDRSRYPVDRAQEASRKRHALTAMGRGKIVRFELRQRVAGQLASYIRIDQVVFDPAQSCRNVVVDNARLVEAFGVFRRKNTQQILHQLIGLAGFMGQGHVSSWIGVHPDRA
jgi:hypothetical protein